MTNWKQLAAALDLNIPEADLARSEPTLDALQTSFRALRKDLPLETEPAFVLLAPPEDRP
jgi:hypothetical protein